VPLFVTSGSGFPKTDLTGDSVFISSNPSVATISNAPGSRGQVTALSAGSVTFTATYFLQSKTAGGTAVNTVPIVTLTVSGAPGPGQSRGS